MSVRVEQLRYHWMDFHEIWYLSIFGRYVQEIQIVLKCDKNCGHYDLNAVMLIFR